jgi:ABC-type uncharacterized transport system permease subunit
MSEKDLSRALLRGEGNVDIQAMTQHILQRDRRRIWILGVICVIAWMAVVMLPWATVLPMVARLSREAMAIPTTAPALSPKHAAMMQRILKEGTLATFFGSLASMFVAAICTVSFIILSRRATLRQVNARLSEIAAQLKTR